VFAGYYHPALIHNDGVVPYFDALTANMAFRVLSNYLPLSNFEFPELNDISTPNGVIKTYSMRFPDFAWKVVPAIPDNELGQSQLERQILTWFVQGDSGVSSTAMAGAILGVKPNERDASYGNNPHDSGDFGRCLGLLRAAPDARQHLNKVAALSPVWTQLVANWDELEGLYNAGNRNDLHDRIIEICKQVAG
jgi:hypothetical protein